MRRDHKTSQLLFSFINEVNKVGYKQSQIIKDYDLCAVHSGTQDNPKLKFYCRNYIFIAIYLPGSQWPLRSPAWSRTPSPTLNVHRKAQGHGHGWDERTQYCWPCQKIRFVFNVVQPEHVKEESSSLYAWLWNSGMLLPRFRVHNGWGRVPCVREDEANYFNTWDFAQPGV